MIEVTGRKDQHIAIFGLGASGRAAARALDAGGARISAWDDEAPARDHAARLGIRLADPAHMAWSTIDALVLSPGIPLSHPRPHSVVQRANAARRPVIGDIDLLFEACPAARFIGITGTNGKSTTTALLGHILSFAGGRVETGGNLGMPALALEPLAADGCYVLELSSYQLDLVQAARFDVAVLLNISPDHLDRHGDMAGYIAAKRRIFANRRDGQTAIIGQDDGDCRAVSAALRGAGHWRIIPVSSRHAVTGGVHVRDGHLIDTMSGPARSVCDLRGSDALPGAHNWQNAAAAYAAARVIGVAPETIAAAIAGYPGLAHRQELVAEIDGVRYINDSKATNPEAASRALACYDTIYWIAGGRPKAGGLDAIEPCLGRIRHAFLIGEAEGPFYAGLADQVAATRAGDLASALRQAHAMAQRERPAGAVVLLSPACASFDQWPDFAARGDAFRALVQALAGADDSPDGGNGGRA
jgi:UDP-N-acetylmuramoylalanine--D-glutamate ligase